MHEENHANQAQQFLGHLPLAAWGLASEHCFQWDYNWEMKKIYSSVEFFFIVPKSRGKSTLPVKLTVKDIFFAFLGIFVIFIQNREFSYFLGNVGCQRNIHFWAIAS
jgi:hypothetical protein